MRLDIVAFGFELRDKFVLRNILTFLNAEILPALVVNVSKRLGIHPLGRGGYIELMTTRLPLGSHRREALCVYI